MSTLANTNRINAASHPDLKKGTTGGSPTSTGSGGNSIPGTHLGNVRAYYSAVAQDYRAWSPLLNMHFGYWSPGINPLQREAMLERMNLEVLRKLNLPFRSAARLADLGCGAGATARTIVRHRRHTTVDAVTLVSAQIVQGAALNEAATLHNEVRFHLADYAHTDLAGAAYDGVYALESACHASGPGKRALVREAARLLKPGGTLVIADALRRNAKPLPSIVNRIYQLWCRDWAVEELAEKAALHDALKAEGLTDIRFEDISWRVAMSALHIPFLATRFAMCELWRARFRLDPWRKGHIMASYAAFALGAWLPGFGYYMVTARKPLASR